MSRVGRGLTGWQVTNWSIWAADGRGVRHDLVRGDDRAEVGEDSAWLVSWDNLKFAMKNYLKIIKKMRSKAEV